MALSCHRCSPALLRGGDILLGLFVFFPCNVLFWRGAWDLMDAYILPGDLKVGSWITLAVGVVCRLIVSALQSHMDGYFHPQKRPKSRKVFIFFFNFFYAIIVISHWRGLWTALDCYTDYHNLVNNGISLAVSLVTMWLLRCSNTTLSAPFYCVLDSREDFFVSEPRFGSKPDRWGRHFLDQLFTQLFCYSSAIAFWRALWNLQGIWIFPERYLLSNLISIASGFGLIIVLFITERPAQSLAARLEGRFWLKLLEEDVVTLTGASAVIFLWRGLWNILVVYVLPYQPVGGITSLIVGGVPLWVAGCASSLYDITLTLDGEFPDGDGCTWDILYLQAMFGAKNKQNHDGVEHNEKTPSLPTQPTELHFVPPEEHCNGWAKSHMADSAPSARHGNHASNTYIAFTSSENSNCFPSSDTIAGPDSNPSHQPRSPPSFTEVKQSPGFSLRESSV